MSFVIKLNLHLLLLAAIVCLSSCSYENVKLIDNGYEGVVIAINPNVPEDQRIIESLQVISLLISTTKLNHIKRLYCFKVYVTFLCYLSQKIKLCVFFFMIK